MKIWSSQIEIAKFLRPSIYLPKISVLILLQDSVSESNTLMSGEQTLMPVFCIDYVGIYPENE